MHSLATHCKTFKIRLKIRRGQLRGGSPPPPGTISNTNILCGFRVLRRSLVRCVRAISGLATALRYEIRYSAHPLYFQQLGFVCSGLYFCRLFLFTPDYGMRGGLDSDQVLAVARVFTQQRLSGRLVRRSRVPSRTFSRDGHEPSS